MRIFNDKSGAKAKAFIGILASLLIFASAAVHADAPPKTLRIGMSQFPSTLHPLFDEMLAKTLVLGAALRPMTADDAAWNPVCIMCTQLPSLENGLARLETHKDGTKGIAATYTLLKDADWGDGVPVTTKDVLFTWKVGRHPQSGASDGEFFSKDIQDITAVDDKTFVIHFDKVKCDFASIDDFFILPEHLERKIFEADPAAYKNRTLYVTDPANPGLYSGPYKVVKIESGVSITLDKNPAWHGKAPAFDTVVFKAIENSASLSANLLSGDIDYIAGELGLSLDQALAFEKRLKATKPGQFETIYKPGLTFEHIDFNLQQKPFDDLRVRQALLYGTDRAAINKTLFDGRQPLAATDVNPLDTIYADDVRKYPYDPASAEKLLDDAGWKKDADGYRYNAQHQKLGIILSTTAGNTSREVIEQAIQSDWKKIGVDTQIKNEQPRVFFGDTMRERKFKGGMLYAWISAPRSVPKTTLYSSMVPTAANNYAGQNYAGYKNPKMDKIIDDLDTVCTPKENTALWHDLQQTYANDLPSLPLYYRVDSYFIPAWLKGVTPTGHQHPSTLWIENWSSTK